MTKPEKIAKLQALARDCEASFAASVHMEAKKADDDRLERAREVFKAALEEMINE